MMRIEFWDSTYLQPPLLTKPWNDTTENITSPETIRYAGSNKGFVLKWAFVLLYPVDSILISQNTLVKYKNDQVSLVLWSKV